jgi:hypothetical protein
LQPGPFFSPFWGGGPGPGQLAQHIRQKKKSKFATVLKSRQNQHTFFLHGLKQKLDRFFNASKQLCKKMKHPRQKKLEHSLTPKSVNFRSILH